jgi:hypothetical protein
MFTMFAEAAVGGGVYHIAGRNAHSNDAEYRSMSAAYDVRTWSGPPQAFAPANALADHFLHIALYITVLSSFFVLFEPAPYEFLAGVLGIACVLARVTVSRMVLPLLVLLLIRDVPPISWPR